MKKRIMLRVPDKMYEEINRALKQGKTRTISELVRAALSEYLKKVEV